MLDGDGAAAAQDGRAIATDVVDDPRWFGEDYDARTERLSFVRVDRETLTTQPFLDYRWRRDALVRREAPLDALAARLPPQAKPPDLHFIWHTSFCCSTLIAEALDKPGRNLSLREPLALVSIADAKRACKWTNRTLPPRLSEIALRLLARPMTGDESVTIKPSNFANALIADAIAHTRGKALFLYSDLESFLISIEKGGDQLRKYARHLFGSIAGDSEAVLPLPPQEIFQMSDLEIAALAWHMQIAHFRHSAKSFAPGRAAALDCDAFLADPRAALVALDVFFELDLGGDHLARVVAGPILQRHAKNPAHPFDARQRQAQADGIRRRAGADLRRIVEWSYGVCSDSLRGDPLPGMRQLLR